MKKSTRQAEGNIEINEQFQRALEIMEDSNRNVFITGKAGTGKSTLLEYFRSHTSKRVPVLAPTGVAALNVGGETIHSFFRFKPDIALDKVRKLSGKQAKKNLYKKLDAIIIDEISMVRADLLDCVDRFLRLNGPQRGLPFGGLQMIFIGDLYQLPPVVTGKEKEIFRGYYETPYFFSAKCFSDLEMEFIELEKVYRQKDREFIHILNSIRNNSIGEGELERLNSRFDPRSEEEADFSVTLTTTNSLAAQINERQLSRLSGPIRVFEGEIAGDFDQRQLPTETTLHLKEQSQVMLLNNDSEGRWVNGTLGRIVGFKDEEIVVELAEGPIEEIKPFTWEIFHFKFNQDTGSLETEPVGTFTQYPLRLAWAITIHKSQGKTFDRVVIDIGRGAFASGQVYVALSRCRSLPGIVLKKPLKKSHIFMDSRVRGFVTRYQYRLSEKRCSPEEKLSIIRTALENGSQLQITYLKASDEKSSRTIRPLEVGEMEYRGVRFLGVRAYCHHRQEERVFRLDRILELKEA